MGPINVRTLQQALTVWANSEEGRRLGAASPGRIDGSWGPITHESLRSFVSVVAPQRGLDAARVLAPLRSLPVGASMVELPDALIHDVEMLALSYPAIARRAAAEAGSSVTEAASAAITTVRRMPTWGWVALGLGAFGLGYWIWTRIR